MMPRKPKAEQEPQTFTAVQESGKLYPPTPYPALVGRPASEDLRVRLEHAGLVEKG